MQAWASAERGKGGGGTCPPGFHILTDCDIFQNRYCLALTVRARLSEGESLFFSEDQVQENINL